MQPGVQDWLAISLQERVRKIAPLVVGTTKLNFNAASVVIQVLLEAQSGLPLLYECSPVPVAIAPPHSDQWMSTSWSFPVAQARTKRVGRTAGAKPQPSASLTLGTLVPVVAATAWPTKRHDRRVASQTVASAHSFCGVSLGT
jgi:hypothetical protein